MKIKLNSVDMSLNVADVDTLGNLFAMLKSEHFRKNEFVTAVAVNGEVVPEKEYDTLVEKKLSDVESVEITTDHPRDISLRAFDKMDEFLDSLVGLIGKSADKFRLEDDTEANKHFIGCVEGLQTFVGIVEKVRVANDLDFNAISHEGVAVAKKLNAFLEVFNNLHKTQQEKDWVNLADVLEYELVPLVGEWKVIIPLIGEELRKGEE